VFCLSVVKNISMGPFTSVTLVLSVFVAYQYTSVDRQTLIFVYYMLFIFLTVLELKCVSFLCFLKLRTFGSVVI
jgi:hypothetical protein